MVQLVRIALHPLQVVPQSAHHGLFHSVCFVGHNPFGLFDRRPPKVSFWKHYASPSTKVRCPCAQLNSYELAVSVCGPFCWSVNPAPSLSFRKPVAPDQSGMDLSGLWSLVSGLWSLVSGLWSLISGHFAPPL